MGRKENQKTPERVELKIGWGSFPAIVTENCVDITVSYNYPDSCCGGCDGDCWPTFHGNEGETSFEMNRSDVIALAKAMKITTSELR